MKDDIAYEAGYYRVTLYKPGGDNQVLHGMFHATFKKINARWKIYLDEDEALANFSDAQFYQCEAFQTAQK